MTTHHGSLWAHVCGRGLLALPFQCLQRPCDTALAAADSYCTTAGAQASGWKWHGNDHIGRKYFPLLLGIFFSAELIGVIFIMSDLL